VKVFYLSEYTRLNCDGWVLWMRHNFDTQKKKKKKKKKKPKNSAVVAKKNITEKV